jgi:hypothetical protein
MVVLIIGFLVNGLRTSDVLSEGADFLESNFLSAIRVKVG